MNKEELQAKLTQCEADIKALQENKQNLEDKIKAQDELICGFSENYDNHGPTVMFKVTDKVAQYIISHVGDYVFLTPKVDKWTNKKELRMGYTCGDTSGRRFIENQNFV